MLWMLGYVVVIWAVEVVNTILGHRLDEYGIVPRATLGLRGLALGPFLHSGFGHVMSNTAPIVILGGLVATRGRNAFLAISGAAALFGGLGVWLFARPGVHIGASGVAFGYFGFLLARGWYERSFVSILISAMVLIFYGGLFFTALPFATSVSWEGHLFGLISGVAYARVTRRRRRQRVTDRTAG
ncbi:MAG: rhomboid family intramembrane serine protease [SAR202 cluster bacterium]|jgi:membrane associated rhomboid family serine protease|nr:rhomboid family intramembrane serine protease [Chloroflexota bacterium]MDP6421066.1 rhomboid family intramembrane serine protease [SAR202 cluster bacterium]HAL47351.1 rhomboid family intramembrane serine protease [Dehalococcoidia bacterium]MDP6664223.1 rhomboid family intramembrane serine protease [SAR202 cluster bacterium]MDP6799409.1 rhomboid family intramembrane serine protease [SAR202 cluster bacterium]|tara:strand:+ start:7612 stop:8166 length:555 start_codon:yes stop_codon:yes gene_type:complete